MDNSAQKSQEMALHYYSRMPKNINVLFIYLFYQIQISHIIPVGYNSRKCNIFNPQLFGNIILPVSKAPKLWELWYQEGPRMSHQHGTLLSSIHSCSLYILHFGYLAEAPTCIVYYSATVSCSRTLQNSSRWVYEQCQSVLMLAYHHCELVVNLPLLQNHSSSSLNKSCLLAFDKNSINTHLHFHFTFNFISCNQLYSCQTHHQLITLEQLLHMKLF